MSVTVTMTGSIPIEVWDRQAMDAAAVVVRSVVVTRAFQDHKGSDDRAMRAYSRNPMKLYYRTATAKRLKPKGGAPFKWVRGPRTLSGGYDETKIGDEGGRYYADGYAGYKRASTRGGGEVNLTLSGQMARQFRVLRVDRFTASIGFSGQSQTYGPHTDAARPWVAPSHADVRTIEEHLPGIVAAVLERQS